MEPSNEQTVEVNLPPASAEELGPVTPRADTEQLRLIVPSTRRPRRDYAGRVVLALGVLLLLGVLGAWALLFLKQTSQDAVATPAPGRPIEQPDEVPTIATELPPPPVPAIVEPRPLVDDSNVPSAARSTEARPAPRRVTGRGARGPRRRGQPAKQPAARDLVRRPDF